MKVVTCMVCSWESVLTEFFLCWSELFAYSGGKYEIDLLISRYPYIDTARDQLVEAALKRSPDYIFWLDVDHTFQRDLPEKLIHHVDSGKLIISGVTAVRRTEQPLIYDFDEKKRNSFHYRQNVPKNSLIRVDGVGMGCGVMCHPKVFSELLKPPYFQTEWNEQYHKKSGEDIVFFQKCKDAKIDVWCDTSLILGHLTIGQTLPRLTE